jgi:hypothetical protein
VLEALLVAGSLTGILVSWVVRAWNDPDVRLWSQRGASRDPPANTPLERGILVLTAGVMIAGVWVGVLFLYEEEPESEPTPPTVTTTTTTSQPLR